MEKYQEARQKALKNLKIADHMLSVTYDLIKDPKLLPMIIDNLFLALVNSMAAILYFELRYKRVSVFQDDFKSKYNLLRDNVKRLNIPVSFLSLIMDVKNLILLHKKSPVEFVKNNKFVICSDNYQFKTMGADEIKEYLAETRAFIYLSDRIVSQNERIFN